MAKANKQDAANTVFKQTSKRRAVGDFRQAGGASLGASYAINLLVLLMYIDLKRQDPGMLSI